MSNAEPTIKEMEEMICNLRRIGFEIEEENKKLKRDLTASELLRMRQASKICSLEEICYKYK